MLAPNWLSCMEDMNAMISPSRKLMRPTMGRASVPVRSMIDRVSPARNERGWASA